MVLVSSQRCYGQNIPRSAGSYVFSWCAKMAQSTSTYLAINSTIPWYSQPTVLPIRSTVDGFPGQSKACTFEEASSPGQDIKRLEPRSSGKIVAHLAELATILGKSWAEAYRGDFWLCLDTSSQSEPSLMTCEFPLSCKWLRMWDPFRAMILSKFGVNHCNITELLVIQIQIFFLRNISPPILIQG